MDYNALLITVIAEKQQEILALRSEVEQLRATNEQLNANAKRDASSE